MGFKYLISVFIYLSFCIPHWVISEFQEKQNISIIYSVNYTTSNIVILSFVVVFLYYLQITYFAVPLINPEPIMTHTVSLRQAEAEKHAEHD